MHTDRKRIFKSNKFSRSTKIRVFKAYVTSIFLYNCELRAKQTKWSVTFRTKRLSWYGHVCRIDEQTPAQTALENIRTNNNVKKLKGGQKTA